MYKARGSDASCVVDLAGTDGSGDDDPERFGGPEGGTRAGGNQRTKGMRPHSPVLVICGDAGDLAAVGASLGWRPHLVAAGDPVEEIAAMARAEPGVVGLVVCAEAAATSLRQEGIAAVGFSDDLRTCLSIAGPPPEQFAAVAAGRITTWAGRTVLETPHLASMVTSVTRQPIVLSTGTTGSIRAHIARRLHRPPVVTSESTAIPRISWVCVTRDRRPLAEPSDLTHALAQAGVSLERLPVEQRRHLVSLVREAKVPATRQARIAQTVDFLLSRTQASPGESS
jgi:hypothetical protein